ncbi:MAG TPA: ethanolamine ammonia-lyase subunit EutC [Haliscomenobacter sp.]|uniref:ethanolamine ammonia-lyase subunit EutC n=1 Tax=Haliscomenobacter sp. TaxID=2717303 RepID=UPI002C187CC9|nr:ethanolamine ammonia-lyase subunit EutC [Haliscomenobacter sp.]HOY18548.1 ethanolamine ammonia-lyase subunit EutC [Haliscomenobacter sp.]HPH18548.1 ethanolamine ammonia-lyase subunit EutC [Haliscomenobacter sp.]
MKKHIHSTSVEPDPWHSLKAYTDARIALGHTGTAIPLKEVLQFKLAFAHAKDAVYSHLEMDKLQQELSRFPLPQYLLHSRAMSRSVYLQRPDWGRQLDEASTQQIQNSTETEADVAIILADGLSATAINQHAFPVLQRLIPALQKANYRIAPLSVVEQARVAIGDEIAHLLKAKMSVVLIGERPGLTSPYSMGAYLTYAPEPGTTDERRNCISNIRPEGLPYEMAVQKIVYLIQESLRLQLSGVALKDNAGHPLINDR